MQIQLFAKLECKHRSIFCVEWAFESCLLRKLQSDTYIRGDVSVKNEFLGHIFVAN